MRAQASGGFGQVILEPTGSQNARSFWPFPLCVLEPVLTSLALMTGKAKMTRDLGSDSALILT